VQTLVELRCVHESINQIGSQELTFLTNRLMSQFKHNTCEQVRMADLIGSITQEPQSNYEIICKEEYEKGGDDHYPENLRKKLRDI
jgi:hypothetical protein